MSIRFVRFDEVQASDLQALAADGEREGLWLEAKLALPGSADDDRREFLRDISAFANADGGDVLYGAEDVDGVIVRVDGVEIGDVDGEINRLASLARDAVDPRIASLRIRPVVLPTGHVVMHVRIPRSPDAPHMVTLKGLNQYWMRYPAGKARMSAHEVRRAVLRTESWSERLVAEHLSRLRALPDGCGPLEVVAGSTILTAVVPMSESASLDLSDQALCDRLRRIGPPVRGGGYNSWYTFEGFLLAPARAGEATYAYRLCCHSGKVESCYVDQRDPGDEASPRVLIQGLEQRVVDMVTGDLRTTQAMDIGAPLAVVASVAGLRGWKCVARHDDSYDVDSRLPIRIDPLTFGPIVLDDYPSDVRGAIFPLVNRLWQAGGFPGAPAAAPESS